MVVCTAPVVGGTRQKPTFGALVQRQDSTLGDIRIVAHSSPWCQGAKKENLFSNFLLFFDFLKKVTKCSTFPRCCAKNNYEVYRSEFYFSLTSSSGDELDLKISKIFSKNDPNYLSSLICFGICQLICFSKFQRMFMFCSEVMG